MKEGCGEGNIKVSFAPPLLPIEGRENGQQLWEGQVSHTSSQCPLSPRRRRMEERIARGASACVRSSVSPPPPPSPLRHNTSFLLCVIGIGSVRGAIASIGEEVKGQRRVIDQ